MGCQCPKCQEVERPAREKAREDFLNGTRREVALHISTHECSDGCCWHQWNEELVVNGVVVSSNLEGVSMVEDLLEFLGMPVTIGYCDEDNPFF